MFVADTISFREIVMKEPLPLATIQNAVIAFLRGRDDVALWQAKYHMQNWLDCMRTRKLPLADVEIGHRSVTVCHLANITRRLGRKLRWDPQAERFVGDEEANGLLSRPRRKGYELPGV